MSLSCSCSTRREKGRLVCRVCTSYTFGAFCLDDVLKSPVVMLPDNMDVVSLKLPSFGPFVADASSITCYVTLCVIIWLYSSSRFL